MPSVTYVHKISGITDFTGYGELGFYFPLFGRITWDDEHKTDSDMVFFNPANFQWEFDIRDNKRTFSPDAGPFGDCCSFERIGVYTAGGDPSWDYFVLPHGQTGFAGSTVDEAARNNTNQSINRIEIGNGTPSSFCLRILQDSTNFRFDSDGALTARARAGGSDYSASIPASDHTYDGHTDMYTFRYENMNVGDYIKIKFYGVDKDPGFSGMLFDPIEACPNPPVAVMGLTGNEGVHQLPEGDVTSTPLSDQGASLVAGGDFDGNGVADYVMSWEVAQPGGVFQSLYMNGRSWSDLHTLPAFAYAVGDLDGSGHDDLAIDFGPGHGLWARMNDAAWIEVSPDRANVLAMADLDGNASKELVANFPGAPQPLRVYWNNTSWTDLATREATQLAAGQVNGFGVEDVVTSTSSGLSVYMDNSWWKPIHDVPPSIAAVVDVNANGQAEVAATWPDASCGGNPCGLHLLYDNGGMDDWIQLDPSTPNAFAGGDIDGNLQGDLMVSWESGRPLSSYMNDTDWQSVTAGISTARSIAVREFTCGDNFCQPSETSCDCPQDCPVVAGDDCCDVGEVSCTESACAVVEGDGCCDYGGAEACSSPDCICPAVTMGTWAGFSPDLYDHPAPAGLNRVLVFVAHGVRNSNMHVDEVYYGGQRMTKLLQEQEDNNRYAIVAVFYLGEGGIAKAESLGRADFYVEWNGMPDPDRRRYESVFFFNADRVQPIEQATSSGRTNESYVETNLGLVEFGHMSMYATTHEKCVEWFPVRDYIDLYQSCGNRSSSVSVAYKDGAHENEVPGAWASSSDAIVIGAVEIKRYSVPEPSATTGTAAALLALAMFLRRRVTALAARPQTIREKS
jgi:hypothetical protein